MTDKLYHAKGLEVWKSPVHQKVDGGTKISVGFKVCTVSEMVGEEGAIAVAELLHIGEASQSPAVVQQTADESVEGPSGFDDVAKIIDPEAFQKWETGDGFDRMNSLGRLKAARLTAQAIELHQQFGGRKQYRDLLLRLDAVVHATASDRPYASSVAKDAAEALRSLLGLPTNFREDAR